jgi:uncharacterized protein (DUF1015 family)
MADILPFRGIIYNRAKVRNYAEVIAPPFDVISKKDQDVFYERNPYNVVRLILGKTTEYDTRQNNPHSRAAEHLKSWLEEGVLVREETPAVYLTAVDFPYENRTYTRFGLIVRTRLHAFDEGVILPHEHTFTNVKSERLSLMKACRANFSPIFSMVADDDGKFLERTATVAGTETAALNFEGLDGRNYRMWRLTDPALIDEFQHGLKHQPFFIADGHHRYETALNYRNWLRQSASGCDAEHPANYVMMYLTSMRDPGLIIRPAHRMLKEVPRAALTGFLPAAKGYFNVEEIVFPENERRRALAELKRRLRSKSPEVAVGAYLRDKRSFFLLTLKNPDVMRDHFGNELHPSLRDLDVTVLTRLIFMEIMGFDHDRLDNEKLIQYTTEPEAAVAGVKRGDFDACFILNATGVHQVREIALQGQVMPRKATYFYPKVVTGLVMNLLET